MDIWDFNAKDFLQHLSIFLYMYAFLLSYIKMQAGWRMASFYLLLYLEPLE